MAHAWELGLPQCPFNHFVTKSPQLTVTLTQMYLLAALALSMVVDATTLTNTTRRVRVELGAASRLPMGLSKLLSHTFTLNDRGRFEISRIVRGRYSVTVNIFGVGSVSKTVELHEAGTPSSS